MSSKIIVAVILFFSISQAEAKYENWFKCHPADAAAAADGTQSLIEIITDRNTPGWFASKDEKPFDVVSIKVQIFTNKSQTADFRNTQNIALVNETATWTNAVSFNGFSTTITHKADLTDLSFSYNGVKFDCPKNGKILIEQP